MQITGSCDGVTRAFVKAESGWSWACVLEHPGRILAEGEMVDVKWRETGSEYAYGEVLVAL